MPTTVYNALKATNITPADVAGMVTMQTPSGLNVYEPGAFGAAVKRLHPYAPAMVATANAAAGAPIVWDGENNPDYGQYVDDRDSNRRRCRHTARRFRAAMEEVTEAVPGSWQAFYGFQARDWYAGILGGTRYTSWATAQNFAAENFAPFVARASTDLYLFSWLTAYTQVQLNNFIDVQLDLLRANAATVAGPGASSRQLVFVTPQYHPSDALAAQPVDPTLWQRLNDRLAARGDVDPVAWGVYASFDPVTTIDWATWKATAPTLWPIFRASWGL